ncbi:MAG: ABC transporter ATP-binding protein [Deltaproteobacteria bacterium]|nr:ABC transporter ATP-binding protein [Deltaproteobacteria bacterium]
MRKVYDGGHGIFRKPSPSVVAVDGLDLEIQRGECFGLLGPNGSGKTTTVEMIEGLLAPTAGEVELLGRRWGGDDAKLRERMGVALQETYLPEKLTVAELLTLFRSFYPKPRPLAALLADVELEEKQSAWVGKLSGGQRQRLAIACALVGEPEILFLDEPTTGLDPQCRRQVWGLVASYRARGGTVVLTTHYMEEAERLCDRVAIVDHGKLVRLGTPAELIAALPGGHVVELEVERNGAALAAEELRALRSVGEAHLSAEGVWSLAVSEPERAAAEALALLERKGLGLARLGTRKASLEDVFVALTGRHLRDG